MCSVMLLIRSVNTAICTSAEPLSLSCFWNCRTISCFRTFVTVMQTTTYKLLHQCLAVSQNLRLGRNCHRRLGIVATFPNNATAKPPDYQSNTLAESQARPADELAAVLNRAEFPTFLRRESKFLLDGTNSERDPANQSEPEALADFHRCAKIG